MNYFKVFLSVSIFMELTFRKVITPYANNYIENPSNLPAHIEVPLKDKPK